MNRKCQALSDNLDKESEYEKRLCYARIVKNGKPPN